MKKLFVLIALLFIGFQSNAQKAYQKGENYLNLGIGLGSYNYVTFGNRTSNLPALSLNYEFGIHEFIAVGPYVAYKSWGYRNTFNNEKYNINLLAVGGRVTFHLSELMNDAFDFSIESDIWDIYGTVHVGIENVSYSDNFGGTPGGTYFRFRPVLGVRYNIKDNLGVFSELGSGALTYLTIGATFNL